MQFSVYVDESGDAGIAKVRSPDSPGASPYFVLGAVVCEPTAEIHAKNALTGFKNEIGQQRWKHATDLNHPEKVFLGRELGRLPQRYFAAISNKATLEEYKDEIEDDPDKFYNKCLTYLLEAICGYLKRRVSSQDDIEVILEKRNHDYDRLIRYVSKVRKNPIYPQSRSISILNPFAISARAKGEAEMLEVADFVAHAVYQCSNRSKSNFNIPEPRYFQEIASRFAGDSECRALGVGLKCIHSLEQLDVDKDIEELFRETNVRRPRV